MVRSFRQEPVAPETIDRVMACVVHAPSAGYSQGNEFLVLDAPADVAAFLRLVEHPDFPTPPEHRGVEPPVIVLVLANAGAYTTRYSAPDKIQFGLDKPENWPVPFWDVDAGMASMLILLAAIDNGLGAFFAGVFEPEAVTAHFGVPDRFRIVGMIGLGHPAEVDVASADASAFKLRRRPLSELVHHGHW